MRKGLSKEIFLQVDKKLINFIRVFLVL